MRCGARRDIVGDEPFAVLLADDFMVGKPRLPPSKWSRPIIGWAAT